LSIAIKKRKWLITGSVLLLLIISELVFDIAEIMLGQVLLCTNPLRPKVGRLWVEDEKNQSGVQQVSELVDQTPEESRVQQAVHSMEELRNILAINNSFQLSRDDFIEFYNKLPRKQSEQILNPFELISLTQKNEWQSTRFQLSGKQLTVQFLDGYQELIKDSFVSLTQSQNDTDQELLENMPELQGRVIPMQVFLTAFNNMPVRYRQQVVNDAHQLASWLNGALVFVGISATATSDGVPIYFQVQTEEGDRVYTMIASELGAGYLINEINKTGEYNLEHAKK